MIKVSLVLMPFLLYHIHLFCCILEMHSWHMCSIKILLHIYYRPSVISLHTGKTISLSGFNEDCRAFQIILSQSLSCLCLSDIDEKQATAIMKLRSESHCSGYFFSWFRPYIQQASVWFMTLFMLVIQLQHHNRIWNTIHTQEERKEVKTKWNREGEKQYYFKETMAISDC